MRLYDTARREVVRFEPGPVVTMYTYGVMPHVYMVTTGPGSKGTTSPRAVS